MTSEQKDWHVLVTGHDSTEEFYFDSKPDVEKGTGYILVSGSFRASLVTVYLFEANLRSIVVEQIDSLLNAEAA